jgi:hypothetical protein
VLLREIWQGKVWTVRPVIVVRDTPELIALYLPEGAMWRGAESLSGETLRVPWEPWRLSEPLFWKNHGLRLYPPGEAYSLSLYWDSSWTLLNWYVNVEEPLRTSDFGFDYMDWTLDIVVSPDMSDVKWKDEDELAEAVARGVYTQEHAQEIREAGQRALDRLLAREPPVDERWEDWRPDPSWQRPDPPERWE